jgi:hypothetical protein
MQQKMKTNKDLATVRRLLLAFIIILFLSGLTAIPVDAELSFLLKIFSPGTKMHEWINRVLMAYRDTDTRYPFLLYGYDWLAFAHFVLSILFIGPYRDPVRNIWVIRFGMIACVLIFPLAFIAGHFRGIPIGWSLIDCSFGFFGLIPLSISYQKTKQLSQAQNK